MISSLWIADIGHNQFLPSSSLWIMDMDSSLLLVGPRFHSQCKRGQFSWILVIISSFLCPVPRVDNGYSQLLVWTLVIVNPFHGQFFLLILDISGHPFHGQFFNGYSQFIVSMVSSSC